MKLRMFVRGIGLSLARLFACDLHDYLTGERIGRALLVPWRGKVHVIGLDVTVRVAWLPQKRLTYWKQEIGFTSHPPVDFPNVRDNREDSTRQASAEKEGGVSDRRPAGKSE